MVQFVTAQHALAKVNLASAVALTFQFIIEFVYFVLVLSIRMLVYEYVDNGNLDQWLHGDVGDVSPLTWNIRMNIILGTAKGYRN